MIEFQQKNQHNEAYADTQQNRGYLFNNLHTELFKCQVFANEFPVRLYILLGRLCDNLRGKRRRGRRLIPTQGLKVIPHKLLIKTRLSPTRDVLVERPETRRIRGKHFINEDNLIIVQAKLKFRVCDNYPRLIA